MRRALLALAPIIAIAVALIVAGCGGGGGERGDDGTQEPRATSTARPTPAPVDVVPEPQDAELGDASFEALPEARAYFGQLGGSIYQIEMPDDWNGRLVLYLHGFRDFDPTLTVDPPWIRRYLIRNGYAWAASSYSSNSFVPGLAADESAALWDSFAEQFGRPEFSYVMGPSMGGGGVAISAERYPGRYDGALGLCGVAGSSSEMAFLGDSYVAAAYAAGITQEIFEAESPAELVTTRILPALEDSAAREQFQAIIIDVTGGPRYFDREGMFLRTRANLELVGSAIGAGLDASGMFDNQETVYRLGPLSEVSSEEFNDAAIRANSGDVLETFTAGHDTTGDIQIPLLTLHTSGDGWVPISEQQVLRRAVETAGRGGLLVQRAVRAASHCGFTNAEMESGLEALVAWVEDGVKPEGEDLLLGDLRNAGEAFTLAPRLGSPEADAVAGADERITVSGTLSLDGEPLDGMLAGAVVWKDGLRRDCSFMGVLPASFSPVSEGAYSMTVAGEGETRGCGAPGAQLALVATVDGEFLVSRELVDWPSAGAELTFDATFSTSDPDGVEAPATSFRGSIVDPSGDTEPVATVVEAYVGETLCGVTSLPPVVMRSGDPTTFHLVVGGPESVPGCVAGASISFRVDGQLVEQTGVNDFDGHPLDLLLR